MSTQIELSQELFDEIVGHLHADFAMLRFLSTVSLKFRPTCRELLFYTLELRPQNCTRWDSRLKECPDFGNLIKEIHIRVDGFVESPDLVEGPFVSVLSRLPGLTTVRLRNLRVWVPELWTGIPICLQNELAKLIARPAIDTVVLFTFSDIPLSLFSSRPPLKKLQLISCHFTTQNSMTWSPTGQYPKIPIEMLSIHGSHGYTSYGSPPQPIYHFLDHPKFPLDVTRISLLQIELIQDSADQIQRLISLCAPSLRWLRLVAKGGSVSLPHLPVLTTLSISLTISNRTLGGILYRDVLPRFLAILESLTNEKPTHRISRHRLEEIHLPIFVEPKEFHSAPRRFWTELDTIMVKLSPLRVRIDLSMPLDSQEPPPDLKSLIPGLNGSGRLIFKEKRS